MLFLKEEILKKVKLNQQVTKLEFEELIKEINDAYYNDEEALVDDQTFDWLKSKYVEIFPEGDLFKAIGTTSKGFKKVKHKYKLGSLDEFDTKVDVVESITKWVNKYSKDNEYCASDKLDGLTVDTIYEKGIYKQAATRGDGDEGDDITENVAKMRGIPQKLPIPYTGHIKGEIVLLKSNFDEANQRRVSYGKKPFANTRNAASGLTKRLDGRDSDLLSVFFYKLNSDISFKTEFDMFSYIKDTLKLNTPRFYKLNIQSIIALHKKYEEETRKKLDYDIDGLVITVNDIAQQNKVVDDVYRPNYSRKYKFEADSTKTVLLNVINQVGRTGAVTPVAFIEPAICGGVLISKMTLHNYDEIERLGLKTGDLISIIRAKDVIPKIVKVLETYPDSEVIEIPKTCPKCNSKLIREDAILYCKNEDCSARVLKSLGHWLDVLKIKNIGPKLIEKLNDVGVLNTIPDFYKLTIKDIADLENQGEKNAKKLLNELHDKKEITLGTLLAGLNIRQLSLSRAETLEDIFIDIDRILKLTKEDILKVDGFEDILADFIVEGIQQKKSLINEILRYVKIKARSQGTLSGKSFCFSGFRDNICEDKIKEMGGRIATGINRKLDYLVVKVKTSTTNKTEKAQEYGVKVIDKEELEKILYNKLF